MNDTPNRPNRFPWPPIVFGLTLVGAIAASRMAPLPILSGGRAMLMGPGLLLVALSGGLMLAAAAALARAHTTILPHRRSDHLVTDGPFARTRNPIYLAEAILLVALACVMNSWWYALVVPLFAITVTKLAIEREEAHLAARFGADWRAYAGRVRRWI
jgi:protein-S-isoprenylcysteine O-methyltransferase Ste14